ncbi:hypothetical protein EIJ81_00850 (plasmid) [Aliivibrio salmonicida]|uniref:hypothetical protein n=1 Tax=Aliivibrio salmonicida TaxID=40269 RepID=UPI000F6C9D8D|nr:hypothetical protein [Aliivibrio salmonicida]AZL83448.1 hypothetical protein EIJ81_00850 [Aliivibrio salmonicida]
MNKKTYIVVEALHRDTTTDAAKLSEKIGDIFINTGTTLFCAACVLPMSPNKINMNYFMFMLVISAVLIVVPIALRRFGKSTPQPVIESTIDPKIKAERDLIKELQALDN